MQYTLLNHRVLARPVRDPVLTPALLSAGATAANAASTIAGGRIQQQAGRFAQQQKDLEALQQEQAAQESRATAQRSAFEKQREGRLLQSRLQAKAAASGGGADDPTILGLAGDIAGRSALQALMEMASGENRARNLEDNAAAARMRGFTARAEGDARRSNANLSALGTILGGGASIFRRYKRDSD
jgi:hypothetical protein